MILQRRQRQPTPGFLPGESQGWGFSWAAIYGVAQSRTRLKQLSSSSMILGHTNKKCQNKTKNNQSALVYIQMHTTKKLIKKTTPPKS